MAECLKLGRYLGSYILDNTRLRSWLEKLDQADITRYLSVEEASTLKLSLEVHGGSESSATRVRQKEMAVKFHGAQPIWRYPWPTQHGY